MRTYWCKNCEKCVDIDIKKSISCECGKVFVNNFKTSNHINMRNTLSGTTKMEFNTTTVDDSIESMNRNK